LKEIKEECITANVVIEDFITFGNKLKTHQIYDLASFLEEEEKKKKTMMTMSETNDDPKMKDFTTAIRKITKMFSHDFKFKTIRTYNQSPRMS